MLERIAISLDGTDSTYTIKAGVTNTVIKLQSLILTTESTDADFIIEDEDGNNIGGEHHMGKGSGGLHHDQFFLPHYNKGWAVTPSGKGLRLNNLDAATMMGLAIIDTEVS